MRFLKIIFVLLLLAAISGAALLYDAARRPFGQFPPGGKFVEIPRGASTRQIARTLESHGIVRSSLAFELLARLRGAQNLQAGEYFFDRPQNASQVLQKIARGDIYRIQLVIPEGLTIFQVAQRVEAAGLAGAEDFLRVARDPSSVRDIAPQARSLEGFLFPARYEFPRKTTAQEIAQAMVTTFKREWKTLLDSAPEQTFTTLHLVTMASLVERETPAQGERPVIAGVYYNRLRKGIALQCDPTVLYAMDLAGKNDGIIHASDLRLDSPYNTYKYRGLPPGPIGNPGTAALRAALQPQIVDYLYFVSNLQGGHHFARTLEEHSRNVQRYRQAVREQSAAAGNGAGKRPR